tara:strand:+ start:299 stop:1495 length:1197 start_codon:yes stop_codon:yes gene_type:complete
MQIISSILLNFFFLVQNLILYLICLGRERNNKNILVYRASTLGDFIFSIPAQKKLRKNFPESRITILSGISLSNFDYKKDMSDLPWKNIVYPSIVDKFIGLPNGNIFKKIKSLRRQLNFSEFDSAVILMHSNTTFKSLFLQVLFLRLIGIRSKIFGPKMYSNMHFLSSYQYQKGMLKHSVEGPLLSIKNILKENESSITSDISFDLENDFKINSKLQGEFDKLKQSDKRKIFISAGGVREHKRWPAINFIELLTKLDLFGTFNFIFIGLESDYEINSKIINRSGINGINIAGKTDIFDTIELLKLGDLLITNDGGSAHLASISGCKTISIMNGVKFKCINEPYHSRNFAIHPTINKFPCQEFLLVGSCKHRSCKELHYKSINSITSERVFNMSKECLK